MRNGWPGWTVGQRLVYPEPSLSPAGAVGCLREPKVRVLGKGAKVSQSFVNKHFIPLDKWEQAIQCSVSEMGIHGSVFGLVPDSIRKRENFPLYPF